MNLLTLLFLPKHWQQNCAALNIPVDFNLNSIPLSHWKKPIIKKLICTLLLWLPLLASGITLFILASIGKPFTSIILGASYALSVSFAISWLCSLTISIAFSLPTAFVAGLSLGLAHGEGGAWWSLFGVLLAIGIGSNLNYSLKTNQASFELPKLKSVGIGLSITILMLLILLGSTWVVMLLGINHIGWIYYGVLASTSIILLILLNKEWQGGIILRLTCLILTLLLAAVASLNFWGVGYTGKSFTIYHTLILGMSRGIAHVFLFILPLITVYLFVKRLAKKITALLTATLCNTLLYSIGIYFLFDKTISLNLLIGGSLLSLLLGWTLLSWRNLFIYPLQFTWHTILYTQNWPLHWHAAFWDEHQHIQLVGLDTWLLKHYDRDRETIEKILTQLAQGKQAWATKAVSLELEKRILMSCTSLEDIANLTNKSDAYNNVRGLNEIESLLRNFLQISVGVNAAIQQIIPYYQQQSLQALLIDLGTLSRECLRTSTAESLAVIAEKWQNLLQHAINNQINIQKETLLNPYIPGNPLKITEQIFVGRDKIALEIETLLYKPNCPPLWFYGQRRMGKTSILYHLPKFLPKNIIPIFSDVQGNGITNNVYFFSAICCDICTAVKEYLSVTLQEPELTELEKNPVRVFNKWLLQLTTQFPDKQFLLMLDEIIVLDAMFKSGKIDKEVILGTLRHQIQHNTHFKFLLTVSVLPEELADWMSYLVNIRMIKVDCLEYSEFEKLVRYPVSDFNLQYSDAAFQRIWELTSGHPTLTQALCDAVIYEKENHPLQQRFLADISDVEKAVNKALKNQRSFLSEILNVDGYRILLYLAQQGENAYFTEPDIYNLLQSKKTLTYWLQRELLVYKQEKLCFKIELIRRAVIYKYGSPENILVPQ